MRGDHNNIIHKRLKSCGSSPHPTGGHGNKCKGGDGITQYVSKPPNSGTEAEGRFCKLDFAQEFVSRYELCPKGRSSFPLHRR
jgi:hypothetical protein